MKTTRLIAISALAVLSTFAVHASEADGSERSLVFTSTRSAADVKAETAMPVHITNGGTGFIGVGSSATSRDALRIQAASAVRIGNIPHGEISAM